MVKAAQIASELDGPGASRARRLLGRGMGVVLVSLLSLPGSAHAALPELQVPVLTEVARMAASVVPAGVQPTSTPAVAAPAPTDTATPALSQADEGSAPAASAAAPQPDAKTKPPSPPPAPAVARPAVKVAESAEGASPGTGGVLAKAQRRARVAPPASHSSLRTDRRAAVTSHRTGFSLRPQSSPATPLELSPTASSPASLLTALGPLAASAPLTGAGTLVTFLVLFGGALLIALMCADAVGVGPRHNYLRRQLPHHRWPPWR